MARSEYLKRKQDENASLALPVSLDSIGPNKAYSHTEPTKAARKKRRVDTLSSKSSTQSPIRNSLNPSRTTKRHDASPESSRSDIVIKGLSFSNSNATRNGLNRGNQNFSKESPQLEGSEELQQPSNDSSETMQEHTVPAKIHRPLVHRRFDSEDSVQQDLDVDPAVRSPELSRQLEHLSAILVESEIDSDDEAPEAVTNVTSQSQAQTAIGEVSKAIQRQQEAVKQKRKLRDANLKEQAVSSRRTQTKTKPIDRDASPAVQPTASTSQTHTQSRSIPDLLPDFILQAQPEIRLPTPPPENRQLALKEAKRRMQLALLQEPKAPKDIVRDSTRITVLESRKGPLPQKFNKDSRNLRDGWMIGSRERKGLGRSDHARGGERGFTGGFLK